MSVSLQIRGQFKGVVASLRDAQIKYSQLRDASGMGSSEFDAGKVVDNGKALKISYNGRVWDGETMVADAVPRAEYMPAELPAYMTTQITDLAGANAFTRALFADDKMFHFDDDPADILADGPNSAPMFSSAECTALNQRILELFEFSADPFALCVDLINGEDKPDVAPATPSLILNEAQAEAVYSAMSVLNNVGGLLFTTIRETGGYVIRIKQEIEYREVEIWAQTEDKFERVCGGQARETHADQATFAKTYNLE